MAKVFPDMMTILKWHGTVTEGEMYLLNFMKDTLSNDFEIYFQPFLNGDRPDIILMQKNSRILIIEVKDWNLDDYEITSNTVWHHKTNLADVKSPIKQVSSYKENILNLHIEGLSEKLALNTKMFSMITCAVYFHNETKQRVKELILDPFESDIAYQKRMSYIDLITPEDLHEGKINSIINERKLNQRSDYFTDSMYESLLRYLRPPFHPYKDGIEMNYSKEQADLFVSKPGDQKIKGVAGGGKTIILAKRAVNAHLRTNEKVLILTFNISLRNYIKDKMDEVCADYDWSNFHIIHYHEFFNTEANNHNLFVESMGAYDNPKYFERVKERITRYSTILIDEGQDFKYEWYELIKNYFLKTGGEYVIFADEKQNIYKRELDSEKKCKTNVKGRWNESLKKSYRLSKDISFLASKFQNHFWPSKYSQDEIIANIQNDLFVKQMIRYINIEEKDFTLQIKNVNHLINDAMVKYSIHPNDSAVLSSDVRLVRVSDYKFRRSSKEKTMTMFENHESFCELFKKTPSIIKLEPVLDSIRRSKKLHFQMNPGLMKFSTISSFKGWEIDTLFLILTESNENAAIEELIYTGITRARNKLFIINLGIKAFDEFFTNYLAT